ncbi:MAG: ATPase, T2SS/T4P/T4SS family [Betaproteobacteria bacterium]
MSLAQSLLHTITKLDGTALVIQVGETPYVMGPEGQVPLGTHSLTFEAAIEMLHQLVPAESRQALDEFGAIQYELPSPPDYPDDRFTVVAARGGDDLWMEIRRRRVPAGDRPPDEGRPSNDDLAGEAPDRTPKQQWDGLEQLVGQLGGYVQSIEDEQLVVVDAEDAPLEPIAADETFASAPAPVAIVSPEPIDYWTAPTPAPQASGPGTSGAPAPEASARVPGSIIEPADATSWAASDMWLAEPAPEVSEPPVTEPAAPAVEAEAPSGEPSRPAVVLPLARPPLRTPAAQTAAPGNALDRLLRIAAARGASVLYLASNLPPCLRVDAEIRTLESEPSLASADIEGLLLEAMPERNRAELQRGTDSEWTCTVPDVGRVRCMSYRDQRGVGGVFRLLSLRPASADDLGLSHEIQALAAELEGLVLVTGPRSSGKSVLVSALVDLINRTRRDHVITIENEIRFVHDRRQALISQREVQGDGNRMAAAARDALREGPDVLVIEELKTLAQMSVALEAAASGHLVIAAMTAQSVTGAVETILDAYPPEERSRAQLTLADALRGVVAQVLVPKMAGGRAPAREVLLNTPAVAGIIAEGKTSQLPLAIESGRRQGMVSLNGALLALVQSGAVDTREAYRRSTDRVGLVAALGRQGIDTSFVERLA